MKKEKLIVILWILAPVLGFAQNVETPVSPVKNSRHEIGIAWGAFPTAGVMNGIAFWVPGSQNGGERSPLLSDVYPWFSHTDSKEWDGPTPVDGESGGAGQGKEYYRMRHYGALTLHYQYHFTRKHSVGVSGTWLGRHITNYTERPQTGEVVHAEGWENTLSLSANYRFTYYSREKVSFYAAFHFGLAVKLIDRDLLFRAERRLFATTALQVTGFGIEAGKTHAFVSELGFGSQGLLKVGYRYKFK